MQNRWEVKQIFVNARIWSGAKECQSGESRQAFSMQIRHCESILSQTCNGVRRYSRKRVSGSVSEIGVSKQQLPWSRVVAKQRSSARVVNETSKYNRIQS